MLNIISVLFNGLYSCKNIKTAIYVILSKALNNI